MYRQSNLILALAAGLLGGLSLLRPKHLRPKRFRAHRFVLVDDRNNIVGTFKSSVTPPEQTPNLVKGRLSTWLSTRAAR